jgi:hypothetical protein
MFPHQVTIEQSDGSAAYYAFLLIEIMLGGVNWSLLWTKQGLPLQSTPKALDLGQMLTLRTPTFFRPSVVARNHG